MKRNTTVIVKQFSFYLIASILLFCLLTPMAASAQDEEVLDYRLGPGDAIQVRVYGEDDLSAQLAVPGNGRVEYAFVGELILSDKTVGEVQQEIHQRLLGDYLIEPRVTVTVQSYRDIYVYGAVKGPGNYPWQPGLSVRKVIILAGGLTERASGSKWYLVAEGASEGDRVRVDQDSSVQPGDTLTVEESFF